MPAILYFCDGKEPSVNEQIMVQVSKQAVQQWMLVDYLAQKHRFQDRINQFERKYGMTYAEFEQRIETADKEVYEEWDDSISWGAAVDMLAEVIDNIREIEAGSIEII